MGHPEHVVPIRPVGFIDRGGIDLRDLMALAENDNFGGGRGAREFVAEVIELFLQQTPRLFETAEHALDAQDGDSLARACHKLESQAAFFGAHRLVQVCRRLEDLALARQYHRAESHMDALEDEVDRVSTALRRHLGR